jgi:hypothetical protein
VLNTVLEELTAVPHRSKVTVHSRRETAVVDQRSAIAR